MGCKEVSLTEETTKLRYITPALQKAGWNLDNISCEDYFFTDGKIAIEYDTGKRINKVTRLTISSAGLM